MDADGYREALRCAVESLGNERLLASHLNTPPEVVSRWLRGELPIPLPAYLDALELIEASLFR
jgi:hypothetical protein